MSRIFNRKPRSGRRERKHCQM